MRHFSKILLACLWVPFISCSDDEIGGIIDGNDEQQPLNQVNVPKRIPTWRKEHYSITHFNSAQTDAFPYKIADGTFHIDPETCEGGWSGPAQPEKGIDEQNGIYVASNSQQENGSGLMQKIVWKNGRLSTDEADGAWQASYDGGPNAPSIKMGTGTGSTPTLWALEMMKTN